jgi:hypothetical protein
MLIKYKIVALHEVYILLHFNTKLKHNGMSCTKNVKGSLAVQFSGTVVTMVCICILGNIFKKVM